MSDVDQARWVAYVETQLPAACPFRVLTDKPWIGSIQGLIAEMHRSRATFVEVAPSTCRGHRYHLVLWRGGPERWLYGRANPWTLDWLVDGGEFRVPEGYSALAERFVLVSMRRRTL